MPGDVFLISCGKDFLVRPPLNQISQQSFWKTEKDAISGVSAIYDALQTDMGYLVLGIKTHIALSAPKCLDHWSSPDNPCLFARRHRWPTRPISHLFLFFQKLCWEI